MVTADTRIERVVGGTDLRVHSVLTAFDIIDCFMDNEELGPSEIARRMKIPKSTVYRLLLTLHSRGVVARNQATNKYCLGLRIFEFGQMAVARNKLRQIAMPVLEDIRRRTGTTVQLSLPDGADVLVIERLFGRPSVEFKFPPGRRTPCHATSSGKALAAFDESVAEACRCTGFPKLTDLTTSNLVEFDRSIALARARRFAVAFDEVLPGLASVGVPLFDCRGAVVAAVSLVDTSQNVRHNVERLGAIGLVAVRKISPKLI